MKLSDLQSYLKFHDHLEEFSFKWPTYRNPWADKKENDMTNPQEILDYYDELKKSHETDKELEKMHDKIAKLPTTDEKEYWCPDCHSYNLTENVILYDNIGTVYRLTCNVCGSEWTPEYLKEHGYYIDRVAKRPSEDIVNHPDHYISKDGIESIDVIRAFTRDLEWMEAVCTANILKYIMRWKHKNGLEDLKKARWYLNYLITEVEVDDNE